MNTNVLKLIAGCLLIITWVGLVFSKAYIPSLEITPLVTSIQALLTGIGVHSVIVKTPNLNTDKETP